MNKKKLFVGLGVAIAGAGIAMYVNKQIANSIELKFKPKGYKLNSIKNGRINATVIVSIENPTDLEAEVTSYNLKIYADSYKIANAVSKTPFTLKAYSSKDVEVQLDFRLGEVLGSTKSAILSAPDLKELIINIKGNLWAKKFKLPIYIPLDVKLRLGDFM